MLGRVVIARDAFTVVVFGHLRESQVLEEVLEGPTREGEAAGYLTRQEALRLQLVDGGRLDRVVMLGQR